MTLGSNPHDFNLYVPRRQSASRFYNVIILHTHGLRTPREEKVFTTQPKMQSQSQPAAKNDTTENRGCFNQILSFESRKWSPVATF